jgi:hypothetical protein
MVGDREHLQVFADEVTAEAWFRDYDAEGVAFVRVSRKSS